MKIDQPQHVFQVFHYLDKTLDKLKNTPNLNLEEDLATWGRLFDPDVHTFLNASALPALAVLQDKWGDETYDLNAVTDYILGSMRMIVEEDEHAHEVITDVLDGIWYNRLNEAGIELFETTLGPVLSTLSAVVYDGRKHKSLFHL